MLTPHNEANLGEIAKTVIMPGDPLRARYIAENFLENVTCVNQVRGMLAYTGTYKEKELTIMASGMGMPSMGIYSYELYKFYEVENIIRIGSCGAYDPNLKLFDIILTQKVFSEGNFALTLNNDICHIVEANKKLNSIISDTAKKTKSSLVLGNTICTDAFDLYMTSVDEFLTRIPPNFQPIASEMEAFSLFYVANMFHKNASCLMSVVDSCYIDKVATPKEREIGLNNMIQLALDATLNI